MQIFQHNGRATFFQGFQQASGIFPSFIRSIAALMYVQEKDFRVPHFLMVKLSKGIFTKGI